jgi:thrombospondin type 3 repeat protein
MLLRRLICALPLVLLAGAARAQADRLIARGLLEVDLESCAAVPLIPDAPDTFDTLAIDPSGVAYWSRSEGGRGETLYRVDLADGIPQRIGDTGFDDVFAMAWAPGGGLFAVSGAANQLLSLDLVSGRATALGGVPGELQTIAFRADGALFAAERLGGGHLLEIDPGSGLSRVIGTIGFQDIRGMSFIDGALYAWDRSANALVLLDTATGRGRSVQTPCAFPGDDLASLPASFSFGPDTDGDGIPDAFDDCPDFADEGQLDSDGNGIGDACECGDQNEDGVVDALDLLAINRAIFGAVRPSPLCDTNDDRICDVRDLVGANLKIFGGPAYCSRYPPPAR